MYTGYQKISMKLIEKLKHFVFFFGQRKQSFNEDLNRVRKHSKYRHVYRHIPNRKSELCIKEVAFV